MRGTTFPAGHVIAPGHVGWDTAGETWVGPFEPSPAPMDEVERLAETVTRSGMPTHAHADARGAQWTKAIFNASTNPVGALTGLAHGEICDFEPTRRLITGLIDECKAVAGALGIELDHDPEDMVDHAARVAHDHKASMTQDVLARRETEIDFLNGAIVKHGEEEGVPVPAELRNLGARESIEGLMEMSEVQGRYRRVREEMAREAVDVLVVSGSEYTGFDGAVAYMSGFNIVHRYAYVLVPLRRRCCDRVSERGALRRLPRAAWVDERVFVDRPGDWLRERVRGRRRAWASTASTT